MHFLAGPASRPRTTSDREPAFDNRGFQAGAPHANDAPASLPLPFLSSGRYKKCRTPGRRPSGSSATARAPATSRATRPRPPACRVIDIADRDIDVPLSALGERAGGGAGRLVRAAAAATSGPNVVLCSPYVRRARPPRIWSSSAGLSAHERAPAHRRAPAREGVRHPRPADALRHPAEASRAGRAARATSASSTSARPAARAGAT